MPRNLSLVRQEAELLTDVLMLTDNWPSQEIDTQLREQWGMCNREEELKSRGQTLAEVRMEWAKSIYANQGLDKKPL